MKKAVGILVLVLIGVLAYNHFHNPLSEQEKRVRAIEESFNSAVDKFIRATRDMSTPGLAAVADPESAEEALKAVRTEFERLKSGLTDATAKDRAAKLQARIEEFFRKNALD